MKKTFYSEYFIMEQFWNVVFIFDKKRDKYQYYSGLLILFMERKRKI